MILNIRLLFLTFLYLLIMSIFTVLTPLIFMLGALRGFVFGWRDAAIFIRNGYGQSTRNFTSTFKLWRSLK